jgi:EpsI family protein
MSKWIVAIGFLSLNAYIYYFMAREAVIPPRETFAEFPLQIGNWRCAQNEPLSADIIEELGATDTLVCNYVRDGQGSTVGVYIGYHATQVREEGGGSAENSIHPPAHCLPGSGWDIIGLQTVDVDIPGLPQRPTRVRRLQIAKGDERQLVYYWYQSNGRVIADDWKKIVYVGLDRALRGRTDGALVRFTMPIRRGDEAAAEAAFQDLAPRVVPQLPAYVPN